MSNGVPELSPAWWDARYLGGELPWDTGIVPPEIERVVRGVTVTAGWALDIGCGPGISALFLAQNGWRTIGVDLSAVALARGRARARDCGAPAYFIVGDAANLSFLHVRVGLAVDVGCFHAISPERRPGYVNSLAAHLESGAHYLLYAFEPGGSAEGGPPGITPAEIGLFGRSFSLVSAEHGRDRTHASVWYHMRRL